MMVHHIAATIGCTVADLGERLTMEEYRGWCQYFEELNSTTEEKPKNLLDDPDELLRQAMRM